MKKRTKYVYTDGSSTPKRKGSAIKKSAGGWSFCLTHDPKSTRILYEVRGHSEDATNNQMELTAVINALHYCYAVQKDMKELVIFTDSKYVSDTIYFQWHKSIISSGGRRSDGKKAANVGLWIEIDAILKQYQFRKINVDIRWVKGHSGNFFNEHVDKCAKKAKKSGNINTRYEELRNNK